MTSARQTAVVFPGQGSQYVGMGRDLYEKYESVQKMYATAADVLGFDLAAVCFEGPEQELARTRVTQPAIYVHSLAVWRLLWQEGFRPAVAAGHSLGEYSALAAAGYFTFEQGLELVGLRGELMQEADERASGAMAALIGMDDADVERLCEADGGVVVPANYNAPGQLVISGEAAAVERAMESARESGARLAKKLNVGGAFHSPLMEYAADPMRRKLAGAEISPGRIPVVPNVTAVPETDPQRVRELLVEQVTSPVRWSEGVRRMAADGVSTLVEAGPGSVLCGLARRIDRSLVSTAVGTVEQVEQLEI